jgi:hypothetical protein
MLARFAFVGVAVAAGSVAQAAPINYGNLTGTTVSYLGITEDQSTENPALQIPLFGAPTISGNSLRFSPTSFGASSVNGTPDITDGTLTTTIVASAGNFIPTIQFSESGDYSLLGTGTAATRVWVGLAFFVDVLEVNGAPATVPTLSGNGIFSPLSGDFNLVNPGPTFLGLWNGGANIDVNAHLAANGITGQATRVRVVIDNQLVAVSEAGTVAFIKKKEIGGVAITVVPSPASLALVGLGGLVAARRRR